MRIGLKRAYARKKSQEPLGFGLEFIETKIV